MNVLAQTESNTEREDRTETKCTVCSSLKFLLSKKCDIYNCLQDVFPSISQNYEILYCKKLVKQSYNSGSAFFLVN